ncbi:hypothetical protein [Kitasatospora indigofera]|uniref:hypothetical protein n=1 Tax=Kitasatospora indigofera TaxID=67307 RepID=UPI0036B43C58
MNTNATVTWKSAAGHTVTVNNWPADSTHTLYAADSHTATAVQLAEPAQAPAVAPAGAPVGAIGLTGATFAGVILVTWIASKWKAMDKSMKWAHAKGAIAIILVGSWGIFGTITNAVHQGGESVGTSVANVTSNGSQGQTSGR